jgi:hypothetical protein
MAKSLLLIYESGYIFKVSFQEDFQYVLDTAGIPWKIEIESENEEDSNQIISLNEAREFFYA